MNPLLDTMSSTWLKCCCLPGNWICCETGNHCQQQLQCEHTRSQPFHNPTRRGRSDLAKATESGARRGAASGEGAASSWWCRGKVKGKSGRRKKLERGEAKASQPGPRTSQSLVTTCAAGHETAGLEKEKKNQKKTLRWVIADSLVTMKAVSRQLLHFRAVCTGVAQLHTPSLHLCCGRSLPTGPERYSYRCTQSGAGAHVLRFFHENHACPGRFLFRSRTQETDQGSPACSGHLT